MNEKVQALLLQGVRTMGSFNPGLVLPYIEEQLTPTEYDTTHAFLSWVVDNGKTFGHGNLNAVFAEFQAQQ